MRYRYLITLEELGFHPMIMEKDIDKVVNLTFEVYNFINIFFHPMIMEKDIDKVVNLES